MSNVFARRKGQLTQVVADRGYRPVGKRRDLLRFATNTAGASVLERRELTQFAQGPYWVWCNAGTPYLGKSVAAMKDRLSPGERWLTATEAVFLAAHYADELWSRNQ